MAGLLGVDLPDLDAGEELPLLWHWLYLLERPAQADRGADGHPAVGGIPTPPGPGRRRMFAGGRVVRHGPLRCGEVAQRRTSVVSTKEKDGSTGRLTFVTVRHEISQAGVPVITEEQDILYRDPPPPGPAGSARPAATTGTAAPVDGAWSITVDPVLLFRFSALTYNGHRIHYDRAYATDVEGYPGLVVHGPLQALAMTEAARRNAPDRVPSALEFRLVSPLFDHQGMVASTVADGDAVRAQVGDLEGRTTATATITYG
jgi:3-methylfumaryl-CoA hydratase